MVTGRVGNVYDQIGLAWYTLTMAGLPSSSVREQSLSAVLSDVARSLPGDTVTVRELFERIGPHGMLMACVFLNLPFLVPVSIPGVSTAFGLLIVLVGVGLLTQRVPWLPRRLMERKMLVVRLVATLEQGARLVKRMEHLLHPRLHLLTDPPVARRFNGLMIVVSGLLLMLPFALLPFSNTLPALAGLFVALGILERDGLFVLAGYLSVVGTIVYFSLILAGAVIAGTKIPQLFG